MGSVNIGADIGQRQDPTALCVAEHRDGGFIIRHLERLELGMPYPAVAQRIAEVYGHALDRVIGEFYEGEAAEHGHRPELLSDLKALDREARGRVWILADATGVGRPVIDLIREQAGLQHARLTAVSFTSGEGCTVKPHATEGSVGKAFLVSRLQALMHSRRIVLPRTAEARALADELLGFEIHIDEQTAKFTAGAFKVGTHDDLVCALGLACLLDASTWAAGSFKYA